MFGELCSWVLWMYEFSDMVEVEFMLEWFVSCEDGLYVVCLVCELGKCESCYMYFFCGDVDELFFQMFVLESVLGDIQLCVEVLESEVVELKQWLDFLLVYLGE